MAHGIVHTDSEIAAIFCRGLDLIDLARMPHAPTWPEEVERRIALIEQRLIDEGEELTDDIRAEIRGDRDPQSEPEFRLPWGTIRFSYLGEDVDVDGSVVNESLALAFRLNLADHHPQLADSISECLGTLLEEQLSKHEAKGFRYEVSDLGDYPSSALVSFIPVEEYIPDKIDRDSLAKFLADLFSSGEISGVIASTADSVMNVSQNEIGKVRRVSLRKVFDEMFSDLSALDDFEEDPVVKVH